MVGNTKMMSENRSRKAESGNALVIDLEYWYEPEFVRKHDPDHEDDQMPESVTPILDLLNKYETKATFAVVGTIAERHPGLVRSIFEQGHEIASHGYSHKPLYELTEDEFEQGIVKSVDLLSAITGERPVGFRAPSYSLNNSTKWALLILQKHGFKYDASVFPVKTSLYGVPGAPLRPYRPSLEDITREDEDGKIAEFPMTVFKLAMATIPVAGGFYLRLLPAWFLRSALRRVQRVRPLIICVHPWETYSLTPRVNGLSSFARFVTYYRINKALDGLESLLGEFSFKPIEEVLSKEGLI